MHASTRAALPSQTRQCACSYGLGQVALKQEKLPEALAHFEAAAAIHPGSSVLRCCAGATLRRMGRLHEAARQLRVRATGAMQCTARLPACRGACMLACSLACSRTHHARSGSAQQGAARHVSNANALHCMPHTAACVQAAISLDGRNPLARFEVAHVLMALERHGEALGELQQLQARCAALAACPGDAGLRVARIFAPQ